MAHPNMIPSEKMRDNRRNHLYPTLAFAGLVGSAGLALACITYLDHGNADPHKYTADTSLTSVEFEVGANIRYDPRVNDNTPITTLTSPLDIKTPHGAYIIEEPHDGTWIGVSPTDIPNFDAHGDNDNIVWVNIQKASANSQK